MKTNPVGPFLVGVFMACALVTLWLSVKYYFTVNELIRLQIKAVTMNNTRTIVQNLANEAIDYSRRNPSIDPILERFEIKPRAGAATTNAPASKPAAATKGGN